MSQENQEIKGRPTKNAMSKENQKIEGAPTKNKRKNNQIERAGTRVKKQAGWEENHQRNRIEIGRSQEHEGSNLLKQREGEERRSRGT